MFDNNLLISAGIIVSVILLIIFIVFIFTLPIRIAENKNLKNNELTTIRILTWCGLLVGITWIIALFLAIFYKGK